MKIVHINTTRIRETLMLPTQQNSWQTTGFELSNQNWPILTDVNAQQYDYCPSKGNNWETRLYLLFYMWTRTKQTRRATTNFPNSNWYLRSCVVKMKLTNGLSHVYHLMITIVKHVFNFEVFFDIFKSKSWLLYFSVEVSWLLLNEL